MRSIVLSFEGTGAPIHRLAVGDYGLSMGRTVRMEVIVNFYFVPNLRRSFREFHYHRPHYLTVSKNHPAVNCGLSCVFNELKKFAGV